MPPSAGTTKRCCEAGLEVALAVDAVDDRSITLTGGAHFAPSGFGGGSANGSLLVGHEHRERDPLAVGRPRDGARRLDEVGEPRGLAGVHPAHVELRAALGRRHVREARAVGRPARRAELFGFGAQRSVVGAVGVHDPQIAARAVGHDVEARAHVDDAAAVGRDLRIVGVFELEHVDRLQALRVGQVGGAGGDETRHQGHAERGENKGFHGGSSKRKSVLL